MGDECLTFEGALALCYPDVPLTPNERAYMAWRWDDDTNFSPNVGARTALEYIHRGMKDVANMRRKAATVHHMQQLTKCHDATRKVMAKFGAKMAAVDELEGRIANVEYRNVEELRAKRRRPVAADSEEDESTVEPPDKRRKTGTV